MSSWSGSVPTRLTHVCRGSIYARVEVHEA